MTWGKEDEEINSADKWEAWDSNPQPPRTRERKGKIRRKKIERRGNPTHDLKD